MAITVLKKKQQNYSQVKKTIRPIHIKKQTIKKIYAHY